MARDGQEQLAAWYLIENGEKGRGDTLISAIAEKLRGMPSLEPTLAPKYEGNRTVGWMVELGDGFRGFFKPDKSWGHVASHEVAAYELDRALGLNRVPVTIRSRIGDKEGSLQFFVKKAQDQRGNPRSDRGILLLDYLIANRDRRFFRNSMTLPEHDGRVVAIDHGLSFGNEVPSPARELAESLVGAPALERLKRIPPAELRQLLAPLVDGPALDAFLARREKLLESVAAAERARLAGP